MPRHCGHPPFGMREFGRVLTGPAYARRLADQAVAAGRGRSAPGIRWWRSSRAGASGSPPATGRPWSRPGACLLATGVRESSRHARLIVRRPAAGRVTTGTLQAMVYLPEPGAVPPAGGGRHRAGQPVGPAHLPAGRHPAGGDDRGERAPDRAACPGCCSRGCSASRSTTAPSCSRFVVGSRVEASPCALADGRVRDDRLRRRAAHRLLRARGGAGPRQPPRARPGQRWADDRPVRALLGSGLLRRRQCAAAGRDAPAGRFAKAGGSAPASPTIWPAACRAGQTRLPIARGYGVKLVVPQRLALPLAAAVSASCSCGSTRAGRGRARSRGRRHADLAPAARGAARAAPADSRRTSCTSRPRPGRLEVGFGS